MNIYHQVIMQPFLLLKDFLCFRVHIICHVSVSHDHVSCFLE